VAQAERHDGVDEATGLVIRHVVDLEWSRGMLAAIPDQELVDTDGIVLRKALEETDALEARYLACSLAARVAATEYMADTDMFSDDRTLNVPYWRLLTERAEIEERRMQGLPLHPATPEEPPRP
jgi:hypothetical protein